LVYCILADIIHPSQIADLLFSVCR